MLDVDDSLVVLEVSGDDVQGDVDGDVESRLVGILEVISVLGIDDVCGELVVLDVSGADVVVSQP